MQEEKRKKSAEQEEVDKDTNQNEKCINIKREDYKTNNIYEDRDTNNVSNNIFNEISVKERSQDNTECKENDTFDKKHVTSHNKILKLSNEKNNLSSKEKENIIHNDRGEIKDDNKINDNDIPGKDKNGKTDIGNDNNNNDNIKSNNILESEVHDIQKNGKDNKKNENEVNDTISSPSKGENNINKLNANEKDSIINNKDEYKKKKKNEQKNNKTAQKEKSVFVDEVIKEYPRIFATRLPFEASKKDLETYFSKYGKIVDIYVSRNISNNKNKGFGFVSFEKQESMNKVLKEKLHIICGKEIVVDVASMRDDKYKHLFHMPSENYLMKNEKKDKRFMKNRHKTNSFKYPIYNNVNNISDISKMGYQNMIIPNVNNFPSTNYQPLAYQDFNMKASFRNVYSPFLYNPYIKPFNPTYKNSTPILTNDYVYNLINYNIWNNVIPYGNNMYTSKKMSMPNYYYSRPYPNQSIAVKNNITRPQNLNKNEKPRTNNTSFTRKLPGGDEWNKRGYKLFVTKLNSATTIETLRNYFEKFGEIIDIYMPNDVYTNRPRGIAFVTFLDNDSVKKILSDGHSKHIIDGKEVVLDLADPENKGKNK
ncbi:nucleic acid binding protein, putative [Plasmodium gaboni]|uniref:Nucleic acid binding protein, putative n=2 Tax=Plasmodium gaboni TaxID=647221 RepID=A0ABY1UPK9_9APIC|nr:nucleic acid binding protein, putative [Plasmodium gaboni]